MSRDNRGVRLGLLGVVALLLLGVLGTRLWFLRVVDAPGWSERVERLQRRTAYLPPERGRIFDADEFRSEFGAWFRAMRWVRVMSRR